jgi:hypothetical protein
VNNNLYTPPFFSQSNAVRIQGKLTFHHSQTRSPARALHVSAGDGVSPSASGVTHPLHGCTEPYTASPKWQPWYGRARPAALQARRPHPTACSLGIPFTTAHAHEQLHPACSQMKKTLRAALSSAPSPYLPCPVFLLCVLLLFLLLRAPPLLLQSPSQSLQPARRTARNAARSTGSRGAGRGAGRSAGGDTARSAARSRGAGRGTGRGAGRAHTVALQHSPQCSPQEPTGGQAQGEHSLTASLFAGVCPMSLQAAPCCPEVSLQTSYIDTLHRAVLCCALRLYCGPVCPQARMCTVCTYVCDISATVGLVTSMSRIQGTALAERHCAAASHPATAQPLPSNSPICHTCLWGQVVCACRDVQVVLQEGTPQPSKESPQDMADRLTCTLAALTLWRCCSAPDFHFACLRQEGITHTGLQQCCACFHTCACGLCC